MIKSCNCSIKSLTLFNHFFNAIICLVSLCLLAENNALLSFSFEQVLSLSTLASVYSDTSRSSYLRAALVTIIKSCTLALSGGRLLHCISRARYFDFVYVHVHHTPRFVQISKKKIKCKVWYVFVCNLRCWHCLYNVLFLANIIVLCICIYS